LLFIVLIAVCVVALSTVLLVRHFDQNNDQTVASPAKSLPTAVPPNQPSPGQTQDPAPASDLAASFAALEKSVDADVGLSVGPVGSTGNVQSFGTWTSGPAWSTSKVPLVMAAMREYATSTPSAAMVAAITESDNQAAEQIWASLGDPKAAAQKVEAVLRETGDPTVVRWERKRPQYTAFGQSIWSLTDQEHFLSQAACDPRNTPVVQMMQHIEGDQRWGLGTIDDSEFKGGWGPSTAGKYLVRQFGLIPVDHGLIAIAVAAEPNSGSFDDGITALNTIANWIATHLQQLPAGSCQAGAEHP
jgi:hypothetical protein